jgi:hypothetical protein
LGFAFGFGLIGFLCVAVAVATPRVSCAVRTCCMPWSWDQHVGGDGTRNTEDQARSNGAVESFPSELRPNR